MRCERCQDREAKEGERHCRYCAHWAARPSSMVLANAKGFSAPRQKTHREVRGRKLDLAACAVKVR